MPKCRATAARAAANRPLAASQRTNSGTNIHTSAPIRIGSRPSMARPRQPIACSSACAVNEASQGPTAAVTTNRLVSPLRQRVGVISTTMVKAGVIAAARPNPTKMRRIANGTIGSGRQ